MSGTTAIFGLRYPTSGDNVAPLETYFKNLADDIEAALYWAEAPDTSNASASSGTTELVTDTIVTSLVSGGRYRIAHHATWQQSVATDLFLTRIREDSLTGTALMDYRRPAPGGTVATGWHIQGLYTAVATGAKTFVITAQRSVGTGTVIRTGSGPTPSTLTVERVA